MISTGPTGGVAGMAPMRSMYGGQSGPSGGGFGNRQVGSAGMAYGGMMGPRPSYGGQTMSTPGAAGMRPPSNTNRMGPVRMPTSMPGMTPPINPPSLPMPMGQGGINTGPSPNMMPNLGNDMSINGQPPSSGMGIAGPSRGPIMGPGGQSTGIFGQYGQSPNRRY